MAFNFSVPPLFGVAEQKGKLTSFLPSPTIRQQKNSKNTGEKTDRQQRTFYFSAITTAEAGKRSEVEK